MEILATIASGLVVAVVSAVVTVRLSLRRFHSEKWWERKAAAYNTLVEALFHLQLYLQESFDEHVDQRTIGPEREKALAERAAQGRDELYRAAAVGTFMFSAAATASITRCLSQLAKARDTDDYFDYLDTELAAVSKCLDEIRLLAKQDLGVE